MGKKVQINFDDAALRVIEQLQRAYGDASMATVVRDALGFYNWARVKTEQGLSIGTIRADGQSVERVVLPFELRKVAAAG